MLLVGISPFHSMNPGRKAVLEDAIEKDQTGATVLGWPDIYGCRPSFFERCYAFYPHADRWRDGLAHLIIRSMPLGGFWISELARTYR